MFSPLDLEQRYHKQKWYFEIIWCSLGSWVIRKWFNKFVGVALFIRCLQLRIAREVDNYVGNMLQKHTRM